MNETTEMYLIVDDVDPEGRGSIKPGSIPLGFTTREEAEISKRPDQKIIVRDGCPIKTALSIETMSREIVGRTKLESC